MLNFFKLFITVEAHLTILTINELDTLKKKEKQPVRTPTNLPGKWKKRKNREVGKERKRWEGEMQRERFWLSLAS